LVKKHLWPLAPSTLKKYDRVCRLWLTYFHWLYDDADKANATLAKDAELPLIKELKLFIGNLARKGCLGLQMSDVTGWSYHTAHHFVLSIEGMVSLFWLCFLFLCQP
jgi:hypothetical protein